MPSGATTRSTSPPAANVSHPASWEPSPSSVRDRRSFSVDRANRTRAHRPPGRRMAPVRHSARRDRTTMGSDSADRRAIRPEPRRPSARCTSRPAVRRAARRTTPTGVQRQPAQVIDDIERTQQLGATELILDFHASAHSMDELVDLALCLYEPMHAAAERGHGFVKALELAESTHASFVTGLAGASKASIEGPDRRPRGRRRGLPPADRPLAAGRHVVDAVDDAALDRRAAGPARPASRRRGAGGRGARHRRPGHRIFGADEVALGRARRPAARARWATRPTRRRSSEGAALDGDAAVEHALRAL